MYLPESSPIFVNEVHVQRIISIVLFRKARSSARHYKFDSFESSNVWSSVGNATRERPATAQRKAGRISSASKSSAPKPTKARSDGDRFVRTCAGSVSAEHTYSTSPARAPCLVCTKLRGPRLENLAGRQAARSLWPSSCLVLVNAALEFVGLVYLARRARKEGEKERQSYHSQCSAAEIGERLSG